MAAGETGGSGGGGGVTVPVPERATLMAPAALEAMARTAARLPATEGAKRTTTGAEAAGARVSGRAGAVRVNSAAWAPERLRAETTSGRPPVLVSVRLAGPETLQRATLPRFGEAGLTVRTAGVGGGGVGLPLAGTISREEILGFSILRRKVMLRTLSATLTSYSLIRARSLPPAWANTSRSEKAIWFSIETSKTRWLAAVK